MHLGAGNARRRRAPPGRAGRGALPASSVRVAVRASATASMRCSRRRLCRTTTGTSNGQQGHPDASYGDCVGTHGLTIPDWRSGVKRSASPGSSGAGLEISPGEPGGVRPWARNFGDKNNSWSELPCNAERPYHQLPAGRSRHRLGALEAQPLLPGDRLSRAARFPRRGGEYHPVRCRRHGSGPCSAYCCR